MPWWLVLASAASAAPLDPGAFTTLGLMVPVTDVTVDTTTLSMTGGVTATGVSSGGTAVFTFDDVDLDGITVTVTGTAPFALLSQADLILQNGAVIDAAAVGTAAGPAGGDGGPALTDGSGTGPGIGDVGGGGGAAHCGDGGASVGAAGSAYGDLLTSLTGGSGGGGGDGTAPGGGGGGGVELGATGDVDIDGTSSVSTAAAAGAGDLSGGGGGAGGGVLVHGAGGALDGTLTASGADGGPATVGSGGGGGGGGCIVIRGVTTAGGTQDVGAGASGGAGGAAGAAGTVDIDLDGDGDGVLDSADCAPADPGVFPGNPEIVDDGTDQDCDGLDALFGPSDLSAGDLVITEFMADPTAVGDANGEWLEVLNTSGLTVDLVGLTLRDDGSDSHTIGSFLVASPADRLVLAINADSGANGGVTADYDYAGFTIANSADEIVLEAGVTEIDRVDYTSGTFPITAGESASLDPTTEDATSNDDGANWCNATTAYGLGDLGTPGTANDTCVIDGDGDGSPFGTDCDDGDASVYPGAPELCDGILNDCNSTLPADEIDDDTDTYVECTPIDGGGWDGDPTVVDGGDCDDTDDTIFPGAPELCDGLINTCGGALPTDEIDDDTDTYVECTIDGGGWDGDPTVVDGDDCDDTDDTIFPGAPALCDGLINACGGALGPLEIDDDTDTYVECTIDGGGWDGDPTVVGGDDCDDTDDTLFPGAPELCDGLVNACGGALPTDEIDDDTDTFVECTIDGGGWDGDPTVVGGDDCDDTDDTLFPGAPELCDGLVNACGGALPTDEIDDDTDTFVECTIDGGGWDGDPTVIDGDDCDDTDDTVFPSAPMLCDGLVNACGGALGPLEIDDDGDTYVECTVDGGGWDGDPTVVDGDDCDDTDDTLFPGAPELCDGLVNACGGALPTDEIDDDGDTYVECTIDGGGWDGDPTVVDGDDCDDTDASRFPTAPELCDGLINACGGALPVDEVDNDGDTYVECTIDGGGWDGDPTVVDGDDCNDGDDTVFPTATELCDGLDNNCNSTTPNNEIDNDSDTYVECTIDGGGWDGDPTVVGGDDCDDGDDTVFPTATELCDGLDNDCDTTLPGNEVDNDGDAYVECTFDAGGWDGDPAVTDDEDCDDTRALTNPGATDTCGNGIDDDCDGLGDNGPNAGLPGGYLDDDGDGIDYATEQGLGTDDCNDDSDGDGLTDDVEVSLGTLPTNADSDTDGLTDGEEVLLLGTDPLDQDSDSDGVSDTDEVPDVGDPLDSDGDGLIDALDDDDDDDGVLTADEDYDGVPGALTDDTDGDGTPDFRDPDDDDDGIDTLVEGTGDFDGDGLDDYLDDDDDDDGISTLDEITDGPLDLDGDGIDNHLDDDSDDDGWSDLHEGRVFTDGDADPDYLDVDSDGDDVLDADELGNEALPLGQRDTDGDGLEDRIDDDDDGDTIPTRAEDYVTGDPLLEDTDGDGVADFLDDDDDDDHVPTASEEYGAGDPRGEDTDGDKIADYLDSDDDGDSVLTRNEPVTDTPDPTSGDTDGDTIPDYLDDDDDDDGVPTFFEELAGTLRRNVDTDGDGYIDGEEWLDWLVTDSDVDCVAAPSDCLDADGGTTGTAFDDPWDRDSDGFINADDADDDGDGLLTPTEGGAHSECLPVGIPFPGDGIPNYLDRDSDGDGILDVDEFPADSDGDGLDERLDCFNDGCEGDSDGDGLPNCRETEITGDPTAQNDPDYDDDGIPDGNEITDGGCFDPDTTANCTPDDTDNDGIPDIADPDDDGDSFDTREEIGLCPDGSDPMLEFDAKVAAWILMCPDGTEHTPRNTDEDIGSWLPLNPDDVPDYLDDDDDGDGTDSFTEGRGDIDGDGTPNWLDPYDLDGPDADADGDGLDNGTEALIGTDPYDDDSDGDGLRDDEEVGDPLDPTDSDDDGIIDALDPDDDGDGLDTIDEGTADPDGDGVDNHLDDDSDGDGDLDRDEGLGDVDCDGARNFEDRFDDDGPCADDGEPVKQQKYENQGCGCGTSAPSSPLWLVVLATAVARRRSGTQD